MKTEKLDSLYRMLVYYAMLTTHVIYESDHIEHSGESSPRMIRNVGTIILMILGELQNKHDFVITERFLYN